MTDISSLLTGAEPSTFIQPKRLKALLKNLINIYSPHGKENEICEFLYEYLKKAGLPVIKQQVEEDRYNILLIPETAETSVVFLGHIDTVNAPDFDNYKYKEKTKDRIYGLGASDMKSGVASMIEAFITYRSLYRESLPAALALVVGEEENGDGTIQFLDEYHFPYAIVGEPSELKPCFSHYGYIEANIVTRGKRMHASLAKSGVNAIYEMLQLVLKIMNYIKTSRSEVVYNIRNLSSSQTGFVVPEFCEVWLDFHLPPHSPIESIIYEIEEIFNKERKEKPHFDGSIHFTYIHAGYELPTKGDFFDRVKAIYEKRGLPFDASDFRSHSDANLLWEAGIRPILLGPGQLEMAHIPGESVSFNEVVGAAEIYFDFLQSLRQPL